MGKHTKHRTDRSTFYIEKSGALLRVRPLAVATNFFAGIEWVLT